MWRTFRKNQSSPEIHVKNVLKPRRVRTEALSRTVSLARTLFLGWVLAQSMLSLFAQKSNAINAAAEIVVIEGKVEWLRLLPSGQSVWEEARTNQLIYAGDRVRTRANSRAVVKLPGGFLFMMKADGEATPIPGENSAAGPFVSRGILYFFHRGKPGDAEVRSRTVAASIRGTEFLFSVREDGGTEVNLIEGEVELTNQFGTLKIASGESALASVGQAPLKTAKIDAQREMQWTLYYPAILVIDDLKLPERSQRELAHVLEFYREGDLLSALAAIPLTFKPESNGESILLAGLLMAIGETGKAKDLLARAETGGDEAGRVVSALGELIVTVQSRESLSIRSEPRVATEWMARSYSLQGRADLKGARNAAEKAAALAPAFSFAWVRLAEMEFSLGNVAAAKAALERGLVLGPRNANARALQGFVRAAENRLDLALESFEQSLQLDPALANAWLGRGLCKIREGRLAEGREDLQVAATLEPRRGVLRSYLGKAFAEEHSDPKAEREFAIAKELDPNDPTAWLYSALTLRSENRINEAVEDLEHSKDLVTNRRIFRSGLLLDEDRAVRGANLAITFADAGLEQVSLREAIQAVHDSYSTFSGHLFLADSYNALRDPKQVNLRYETVWLNEYLLANLLAPVGAGILSPVVSQQEYSRLFERDRVGVASETTYLSRGDWMQSSAVYGIYGNTSVAAEQTYRFENGERPNNELDQLTLSFKVRHQLTRSDTLYLQAITVDSTAGDLRPLYEPANYIPGLRVEEHQEPLLLLGYHHEWSPGSHTLILGGRLEDRLELNNPEAEKLIQLAPSTGTNRVALLPQTYRSQIELYSGEIQHILESDRIQAIFGARVQAGDLNAQNQFGFGPITPAARPLSTSLTKSVGFPETLNAYSTRASIYTDWQFKPIPATDLSLIGGLSYDWFKYPANFRYPPFASGEKTKENVLPRAGIIWNTSGGFTARLGYGRDVTGASFDQSFRLEPSQVAGIVRSYRSLIPEALIGASAGEELEVLGFSLEQKLATGTFLAVGGQHATSELGDSVGEFFVKPPIGSAFAAGQTRNIFHFEENTIALSADQLLGHNWSVGAHYSLSQAILKSQIRDFVFFPPVPDARNEAVLQQLELSATFNHPSGFFARSSAKWYSQANGGNGPAEPGDDFWQVNLQIGYRILHRHAEISAGVLNLTDQDYRLNPLNILCLPPRERTFIASFKFAF
jgi:tetratricopeptide (TPR) repeat protein